VALHCMPANWSCSDVDVFWSGTVSAAAFPTFWCLYYVHTVYHDIELLLLLFLLLLLLVLVVVLVVYT
jgi:hypothetical protein